MEFLTIIFYGLMITQGTQDDQIQNLLDNAMMMINNSQYEEGLSYLDKILAIDKNNLQALSNKGGVLIKLKKYDESIEYFERALAIKPDFVEALNNKAIALYSLGNYDKASNILIQAINLDPKNLMTIKNIDLVLGKIPLVREYGYAKIEVRSKNGNLVGYTEAYQFAIRYPFGNSMLMQNDWKDIEIKGQKLQMLENQWEFNLTKTGLYSRTDISNSKEGIGMKVIEIVHDGFLVTESDHVKVILDLFRTQ